MAASFGNVHMEKLLGRENYGSWAFAVKNYLEHEDLWAVVSGDIKDDDADFKKQDVKAKSKIILLVDKINYVHIMNAKTSKMVWDKLKSTFEDSGLSRKVGLLRKLITTRLNSCANTEDYVNQIVTAAYKLTEIGLVVSEEWIGTLLLAGLPEQYEPMIMGIESSGVAITGDSIKTKLLQDVQKNVNSQGAFYTHNKKTFDKSSS